MGDAGQITDDGRQIIRLLDEVEQLRTALEASSDEMARLAEDRDRLLRRVTAQARDLELANAVYDRATLDLDGQVMAGAAARFQSASEHEELRVAFEEVQVLTEELEVANSSLHETNKALDQRVQERTQEIQAKNLALTESELRFRTLVEGVPLLVWRAAQPGEWTWASPQWTAFTGQPEPGSHGWGWLEPVHPDDRAAALETWREAPRLGLYEAEYRIRDAGDGEYRSFQTRAMPVRDDVGRIVEWLGTSSDVQDMRGLQDHQTVLLHELQHRVRNTLAVVRSIASSTGETSDTVADFAAHFEGRLNALARTQMVLTRAPGAGVDLESMIREELLAQTARDAQLDISGPDVRISAKAAEVLTLAVHELATNAVKYGALTAVSGRLRVYWESFQRSDATWLRLCWEESGVRVAATAPRREGFGTELIQSRVPYELRGRGELEFRPGGVRCEIEFPLTKGESILQTDAPQQARVREGLTLGFGRTTRDDR